MSGLTDQEAAELLAEARQHIQRHSNSKNRMDMLLDYCPHLRPYGLGDKIIRYKHWLQLLGDNWTGCDIVTPYAKVLKRVLGVDGPLSSMMDRAENAAYNALPEVVTVYRGCDADSPSWVCWSLHEPVANSFPFLRRFRAETPVVISVRAKMSRILAVKLSRNEAEVITFSTRSISVKLADEQAAQAFLHSRHAATHQNLHLQKVKAW